MSSTINLTNQTNALQLYSFAIIIPVGFVTNVLNIVVNARDKFQQTTMGFYNIFWSIFNIFWIICLFLQASIPLIGLNKLILKSDIACKLLPYFVPLYDAIVERSIGAKHWHADETGWKVFETIETSISFIC